MVNPGHEVLLLLRRRERPLARDISCTWTRETDALPHCTALPISRMMCCGAVCDLDRHLQKSLPELHRFRDLGGTLAVPPRHEMQECIQQWCKQRLALWNARSQTEGDDLGIWLLGLPMGLVEVIDGLRSLELDPAVASTRFCARGAVVQAAISCQAHPISLDAACGAEPRTVFSDARCASGAHGLGWRVHEVRLEGVPSINQLRVAAQRQLIAEGARVRDVISSSEGTVAIEQATS